MAEQQSVVTEEMSFKDWAKSRNSGKEPVIPEVSPVSDQEQPKTEQAAPAPTEEEFKAADPEDEKADDEKTVETLANPGVKKRLTGWAKKAAKAEEKAELYRKELERVKDELAAKAAPAAAPEPAKPAAAATAKPKPKPEDYTDVAEYNEALVDWRVDQTLAERDKKQTETQQTAAQQQRQRDIMAAWDAQVAATVADPEFQDFREVVLKGPVRYPDFMVQALYELDHGPKVAYELAKHPDLLKSVSALSPAKAIAKLGRLSAKFDAAPVKETPKETPQPVVKQASAAPAPIRPAATPTRTTALGDDEMRTADWIKKRNMAARN